MSIKRKLRAERDKAHECLDWIWERSLQHLRAHEDEREHPDDLLAGIIAEIDRTFMPSSTPAPPERSE